MTSPSFTQVTFRGRNDDGNETGATWKATQGTDWTQLTDTNFRVRFRIDETASRAWTNVTWNLYYQVNSGGYSAVTGSTPVKFSLSDNFAGGADCTTQLTGGTGTFVTDNNGMKETTGGATNSGSAGYLFETEWCLQIDRTQVSDADTVNLRIYDGSSPIATYTDTPIITVSRPIIIALAKATLTATGQPITVSAPGGAVNVNLNKATLTATGQPITVMPMDLRTDGARQFDGSDDRIDWDNIYNNASGAQTVAAWVKIDDVPSSYRYMLCTHQSGNTAYAVIFYFRFSDATNYIYYLEVNGTTPLIHATTQIAETTLTGKWLHCLATWDGSTTAANIKLYINGVEQVYGTTQNGVSLAAATGKWSIGGRIYDNGRNLDGAIGEVAVWDRVLNSTEIAQMCSFGPLYSATNLPSGLRFCVHPDEPKDLITNTSGTVTGATLTLGPNLIPGRNISLAKAVLSAIGRAITVDAGATAPTNINLAKAILTATGQALTVAKGPVSIALTKAVLTATGRQLYVSRIVQLTRAVLTATGQQATVTKGPVSISLAKATLVANGQTISISAPAAGININLSKAVLSATGRPITVTPGAVSKALATAQLVANGRPITIAKGPVTIQLDEAQLIAHGEHLTIAKGAVTITLTKAVITAQGRTITITAPGAGLNINLSNAQLTANGRQITVVPGAVTRALAKAVLTATGRTITVYPGPVNLALSKASLTTIGRALGVVPGSVTTALNKASITATGRPITITAAGLITRWVELTLELRELGLTIEDRSFSMSIVERNQGLTLEGRIGNIDILITETGEEIITENGEIIDIASLPRRMDLGLDTRQSSLTLNDRETTE